MNDVLRMRSLNKLTKKSIDDCFYHSRLLLISDKYLCGGWVLNGFVVAKLPEICLVKGTQNLKVQVLANVIQSNGALIEMKPLLMDVAGSHLTHMQMGAHGYLGYSWAHYVNQYGFVIEYFEEGAPLYKYEHYAVSRYEDIQRTNFRINISQLKHPLIVMITQIVLNFSSKYSHIEPFLS